MASDPKREKIGDQSLSDHAETDYAHLDHPERPSEATAVDEEERKRLEASRKLENPLAGFTPEQLSQKGEDYCQQHGITDQEDIRAFRLGAMIAGNMNKYDSMTEITADERAVLDGESTHKWRNPKMLYGVVAGRSSSLFTLSYISAFSLSCFDHTSPASLRLRLPLYVQRLTLPKFVHSAPSSRVWTRLLSMAPSPSTKSNSASEERLSETPGSLA